MDEGDIGYSEFSEFDQPKDSNTTAEDAENFTTVAQRAGLIKEVVGLQEQLKDLLNQIIQVEGEHNKKKAENEMLQTYVNNLTRQNMLITNAKWSGGTLASWLTPTIPDWAVIFNLPVDLVIA